MANVTNLQLRRQSGTDNTYYATWDFNPMINGVYGLDHYEVIWSYDTGDTTWFDGGTTNVDLGRATYSPPENSQRILVSVEPIAATYKVNDTDVKYWTSKRVWQQLWLTTQSPGQPSAPTLEIDKYTATVSLDISTKWVEKIKFELYNDSNQYVDSCVADVTLNRATCQFTVSAGHKYRARCLAIHVDLGNEIYGTQYSEFSSEVSTIPLPPTNLTAKASSKTSVHFEWSAATGAKTYEIEYAIKKEYLEGSDATSKISSIEGTSYEKTGLETGNKYYCRIRAVNDQGESAWSSIIEVTVGSKPGAPTTWSSSTTVTTGETLNLYWVHNSEDGSSQTYAKLELTIDGKTTTQTIKNSEDEDEKDKTSVYAVNTSSYKEGTTILWRVCTCGVTGEYGDWSVQRTVDIYAPATLSVSVQDANATPITELTSFPFYISAIPGPKTQSPISYHLVIIAEDSYQTTDDVGNVKMVSEGDEIYSKNFNTSDDLLVQMSAHSVNLENGITYTAQCVVSMDSGLIKRSGYTFKVHWADASYEPNASIGIDKSSYAAYIRPYCVDSSGAYVSNVLLSVYRAESDGSFTEIATELTNGKNTYVTDPHPALNYARYRIVATDKNTGSISYYDVPGYPIKCTSIIIQWAEAWSNFDSNSADALVNPAWSGSLLELKYNVDVSENGNTDVSLVEYIGRSHPTSYYGTQLGTAETWNAEIPRDDAETLYQLRRLKVWLGDAYVREPSGNGYWANVKVSFGQTHCETTIPITLELTRVEGGI